MSKNQTSIFFLARKIALRHWRRLLFFSSCIAIGIAFLFCIGNLLEIIDNQVIYYARQLLAGDVEVSAYRPFPESDKKIIQEQEKNGFAATQVIWFPSMARVADQKKSFLASIKAIEPVYPFYGELNANPASWRQDFFQGNKCLIEKSLVLRYNLEIGDSLHIGQTKLEIIGIINEEPGRVVSGVSLAPRVMVSNKTVEKTGLLRFGSRVRYSYLLAAPGKKEAEILACQKDLEEKINTPHIRIQIYKDTQNSIRTVVQRQSWFFIIVSLVTLIVGTVGMAASVTTFLNEQLETVATLRCLGIGPKGIFYIYLGLCLWIGVGGGVLGAALGVVLTSFGVYALQTILQLTIQLETVFHWKYLLEGILLSCFITTLVNFYKIYFLAKVSPLEIIRGQISQIKTSRSTFVLTVLLSLGSLFGYTYYKSGEEELAIYFSLGIVGVVAATFLLVFLTLQIFAGLESLLKSSIGWRFSLRHGLKQLVRSKSRTYIFLISLVIGFTLIQTLNLIHYSIVNEIEETQRSNLANVFLIDIQKNQKQELTNIAAKYSQGKVDFSPLIRARITHINQQPIQRKNYATLSQEEKWRYRWQTREQNITYADNLNVSETLIAGKLWQPGESAFHISLEKRFSERTGIQLGDYVRFDIQGRPLEGRVTSIRKVDWLSMRPNFFITMPIKAVQNNPQIFLSSIHIPTTEKISQFQQEVANTLDNVSVINVSQVIDTVQDLLGHFLQALEFTAWFCIGVGVLILIGTFSIGHRERMNQVALLRAMGCEQKTIVRIDLVEFFLIGFITLLLATSLSSVLAWFTAKEMDLQLVTYPRWWWEALAILILPLTVGWFINRNIYKASVMENLRQEI